MKQEPKPEPKKIIVPKVELEINPKFKALSNQIQKMVLNAEQQPEQKPVVEQV